MSSPFIPRERLSDCLRYEMGSLRGKSASTSAESDAGVEARRAGREAGYAEGFAEGRAHLGRLAAAAAALEAAGARFEEGAAESLAALALAVARQMLRTDVEGRRTALVAVLRESLASLPDGLKRPHLVMHPADLALVRAQLGDTLERGHWTLIEDHRIEPGGCRIEAAEAGVDATLPTRWKRVCAALGLEGTWNDD